jgi:hypothetical protein
MRKITPGALESPNFICQQTAMSSNENLNDFYKDSRKLITSYIDTRVQLLRLTSIRSLSRVLSMLILVTLIGFMVLFFLLFMVISFSWWIAEKTNSPSFGFMSGGGIFLLILLIGLVFRKPLFLNPLIRLFIQTSAKEEDEEDDE